MPPVVGSDRARTEIGTVPAGISWGFRPGRPGLMLRMKVMVPEPGSGTTMSISPGTPVKSPRIGRPGSLPVGMIVGCRSSK